MVWCITIFCLFLFCADSSQLVCLQATPGVGFVFVAFSDAAASTKAQKALHGRMFGENTIDAMYYSEQLMAQQVYS